MRALECARVAGYKHRVRQRASGQSRSFALSRKSPDWGPWTAATLRAPGFALACGAVTASPHDALFKAAFSQVEHVADELRHVLPADLVARMDLGSLALQPGSFVDDELREHHTDLLYTLALAGQPARVYVLFEHQSSVDPWMPLRLLRYMLRVWEGCVADDPGASRLPVIVPVVLHHSDAGWRAATRFEALVGPPAEAAGFTPHFGFALDDLGAQSEAALLERAASACTRLVLAALQQARGAGDVAAMLRGWTGLVRGLVGETDGRRALHLVLRYLYEVRGVGDLATIEATASEIRTEEDAMQTIAQFLENRGLEKGLQRGLQEGLQRGMQEGRQEGQRELLLRLLHRRFGELPAALARRVAAAEGPQLERWAERLLEVGSVDEVFAG